MKTKEEIAEKHGLPIHDPIQSYHYGNAMEEYAKEYSDHQNKELREKIEVMKAMVSLSDRSHEIQRLTKEVEEFKAQWKHAVEFAGMKDGENTRLRELLGRVAEEVRSPYMTDPERKSVLTDIDNALNPKP